MLAATNSISQYFQEDVVSKIRVIFRAGKLERRNFSYVGLDIKQTDTAVSLCQTDYITKLNPIHMSSTRRAEKHDSLKKIESKQYRQIVGQISWAAQQTRPDVLFDVMELSMKFKHPEVNDMLRAIDSNDLYIERKKQLASTAW